MHIPLHILPHAAGLPLPQFATPHAAGMDLHAALPDLETWVLDPGERRLVPTGLVMAVPAGFEAQIRPRSGLALRHGVTVLNAPGTVDADYRGEVAVLLINLGNEPFEIRRGDRIAQMLVAPTTAWTWEPKMELAALGSTQRGEGGYGSTGR